MVRIKVDCCRFWFTAQAVLVIVSPVVSLTTTTSSCKIDIAPSHQIAVLDKDNVSVTCTVSHCEHIRGLIITNQYGNDIGLIKCPYINQHDITHSYTCTGGPVNYTEDNGTLIECYGQMPSTSSDVNSNPILLLVQDTIEDVTGLTVRKVDTNLLNISWTPVFAYDGLNAYYNVSLNGTCVQPAAWFKYDTSKLDPCEDYLNISITPFINTTDNILTGSTIYWDDLPTEAPLDDNSLNHTIVIRGNGSVFMVYSINSCECPALTSSSLTLQNDNHSFSVTVPVIVSNHSTCSSTASVTLSLYMNLEVDACLHNIVGSTKQNETIFIDTNPLVSFTFMNGTPGVLTVHCNFINNVITMNEYAAGCVVFYTDMDEPVQSIPRNNNESTVTMNITNISSTGYYDFFVIVLPAPVRSAYSEYISVKPNPSTSTAHHSSSCHSSNSTSVTPTPTHTTPPTPTHTTPPTHTTSLSPSASISSSPSCTPCTAEHRLILTYPEAAIYVFVVVILIGVIICCAIVIYKLKNKANVEFNHNANLVFHGQENPPGAATTTPRGQENLRVGKQENPPVGTPTIPHGQENSPGAATATPRGQENLPVGKQENFLVGTPIIPHGQENSPSAATATPCGQENLPVGKQENLPVGKATIPHGQENLPSAATATPRGQENLPVGKQENSPVGKATIPHGQENSPSAATATPHGQENLPVGKQENPPVGKATIPHGQENLPGAAIATPRGQENLPVGKQENLPVGMPTIPHGQENLPGAATATPHGQENLPVGKQENLPVGKATIPHGQENLPGAATATPHGEEDPSTINNSEFVCPTEPEKRYKEPQEKEDHSRHSCAAESLSASHDVNKDTQNNSGIEMTNIYLTEAMQPNEKVEVQSH